MVRFLSLGGGKRVVRARAAARILLNDIQSTVIRSVQKWGNRNHRIPLTKSLHFTKNKVYFVPYFEHQGVMMEMFLCCLSFPASGLHKATDELFFTADEIDHSAPRGADKSDAMNVLDGDSMGAS